MIWLSFLIPSFLFVGAAVYLQPPDDVKKEESYGEVTNQSSGKQMEFIIHDKFNNKGRFV
ncbi:hypothetical protein LIT25_14995 [Bacillus sp. F19]|nr:hypothetical protein LIT25_14995 [Bacillus sp. F19]